MYEWLSNYGVARHQFKVEDLDINDKVTLQEQINGARKSWSELIQLLDDIQGKYVEVSSKISKLVKKITEKAAVDGTRVNALLAVDEEYIALEAEQKALSAGLSMVNAQIEFHRNDLRVLNSAFYQKF